MPHNVVDLVKDPSPPLPREHLVHIADGRVGSQPTQAPIPPTHLIPRLPPRNAFRTGSLLPRFRMAGAIPVLRSQAGAWERGDVVDLVKDPSPPLPREHLVHIADGRVGSQPTQAPIPPTHLIPRLPPRNAFRTGSRLPRFRITGAIQVSRSQAGAWERGVTGGSQLPIHFEGSSG